jgi:hypothetical protein
MNVRDKPTAFADDDVRTDNAIRTDGDILVDRARLYLRGRVYRGHASVQKFVMPDATALVERI